jgi:carboxypeptidase T
LMSLIARPFHYHAWHRSAFNMLPAFSSSSISIPRLSGVGNETRQVYSLKKDMDELRRRGAAKGIVDPGVVSVGSSDGGRELWALKVGLGATHKVLFTGCHHAREWISVEVPYLVAEYLIETYNPNPVTDKEKRIKHLLQNRQIWFVPLVNPDGHNYTMTANREWRANRKAHALAAATIPRAAINGGPVSYPAGTYTGVDINRNYATANWGTETFHPPASSDATTSRDPRDGGANSIWCGISGSGEAESAAISALIQAHHFRASITYHSYSQLLLYPDDSAANPFVQWVGGGLRDLINASGNPYTYESGSALYATTGDLMEYCYGQVAGRPTFTPELRPGDPPGDPAWIFSGLPEDQIGPCFEENLAAALSLINCAGHNDSASSKRCNFTSAKPATKCQFVRHCWQVFQGWRP